LPAYSPIPRIFGRVAATRATSAAAWVLCFGGEHYRRALRIVGADEMHVVTLHALEPHPDIGLDVFHDVPDVKRAIGVWQRGRDEQRAARHAAKTFDAAGDWRILANGLKRRVPRAGVFR
jgi:hypothetical protein